ncbi:MAG: mechanosensitive ion channel domain-containing protein [Geitlerinemataceae cyanobacterium]
MKRKKRVRVKAIVITAMLSLFSTMGYPAFSQDAAEGGAEEESVLTIESTISGDVDPATAVTVDDLEIPVDQLDLLLKSMTLEELQIEAAAWFLILKDKVQEISLAELVIKRENRVIEAEQQAAQILLEAEQALIDAETALAALTPGTEEYEQATLALEEAKQNLQDAEVAVKEAIALKEDLEGDELLEEAREEAENVTEIATARSILEEAKVSRDELTSGSEPYNLATEKIDALEVAILDFETAEEGVNAVVPESLEFQQLSKTADLARTSAVEAAREVSDAGLATTQLEEDEPEEDILEDIQSELDSATEDLQESVGQGESNDEQADAGDEGSSETTGDEAVEGVTDTSEQLETAAEQLEEDAKADAEAKNQLVVKVTELQADQAGIIERLSTALDALDSKGGDTQSYRKYINAVTAVDIDVTDTEGLGVRLVSWLKSEEGGVQWGVKLGIFLAIFAISVVVARILAFITKAALTRFGNVSSLFRDFAVVVVERGVVLAGFLVALTSLGVSLGPILALVGGMSFVLAFALQSNLGNFASGMMLLITKPFDVGDEVQVAGYWSYVHSITLANTIVKDFNGNLVTLPNNTVWSGEIINYTHDPEKRRLALPIKVRFEQDIDEVKEVWFDIVKSHPKTLATPPPTIFAWGKYYDTHLSLSLKAWCPTDAYWSVYTDLLKALQKRLLESGIQLLSPVQTIRFDRTADERVKLITESSVQKDSEPPSSAPLDIPDVSTD